ncbi:hypothetical protein AVEN_173314-1 [Araneus ventricosus]|uniref:Uncharacterized protein n=1 Tax=Araneus ventricosus TaxID=182803 RepID=A0A4Y2T5B2_ARAVE|nr:hypothetical protein AVEN_173314-1 [Araneus ventricosus]
MKHRARTRSSKRSLNHSASNLRIWFDLTRGKPFFILGMLQLLLYNLYDETTEAFSAVAARQSLHTPGETPEALGSAVGSASSHIITQLSNLEGREFDLTGAAVFISDGYI